MRVPLEALREQVARVRDLAGRLAGDRYPVDLQDHRRLPTGYDGPVHVWDVDKTYLQTRFSSMKGLARIPVEWSVDKQAIPGMPEVLRALRRGPGPGFACAPLYFVSASPPQLRGVVQRKMQRDGVEYDGTAFKDWAGAILRGTPWRLAEQVGFKVCALLEGRLRRPRAVEHLYGDDVERDAWAFALYARMLSDDLPPREAEVALADAGVRPEDRRCVHALRARLPAAPGTVARAYVHLESGSPPSRFADLAPLVVPVRGAVQLALSLLQEGCIGADGAARAIQAVRTVMPPGHVEGLVQDAVERGLAGQDTVKAIG